MKQRQPNDMPSRCDDRFMRSFARNRRDLSGGAFTRVIALAIVFIAASISGVNLCEAQFFDKLVGLVKPAGDPSLTPEFFQQDYDFTENGQFFRRDNPFGTSTYEPTWRFGFGPVLLARSTPGSVNLAVDVSNGSALIRSDDLSAGYELGYQLHARWSSHSFFDIEYRYIWLDDWDVTRSVADPGNISIPQFTAGGPFDSAIADYRTRLFSHELNWLFGIGGENSIRPTAGFRWLELHEDGRLSATGPTGGQLDVATRNYLYGTQAGVRYEFWPNRRPDWLELDGYLTFGLFYSKLKSGSTSTAGISAKTIAGNVSHTSLLTDLGIRSGVRIGSHIRLYGGYQLLYIAGVGQVWSVYNATNPDEQLRRGCPWFHGVNATFEFCW